MSLSTITWDVFLKKIKGGDAETVRAWLSHWVFDNDGAALIGECGKNKTAATSLEDRRFILVLMTKGKWQTTLH